MELLEQLELVDVQFEEMKKAVLVFLDEEKMEIHEVKWDKRDYDKATEKWIDSAKKAEDVEKWSQEYFGLSFDRLAEAIGERKDVYIYERFNSLWAAKEISKFDEDMLGQIFETEVTHAEDDGGKISIQFEYEGKTYESKMQYSDFLEARNAYIVNPAKRKRQYAKFEEKFGLLVGEIEKMVGKTIMVEVKKAMGKYIYSEIKPFPKKKERKKTS